jgi:hypothetical protein
VAKEHKATLMELRFAELEQLRERDGVVDPREVVEYAKNPQTALHSFFEWDNSVAAEKYRVQQARELIRAIVTVVDPGDTPIVTRAYVRLSTDGQQAGYRLATDVLSDPEQREVYVRDAMREFAILRKRYQHIVELAALFSTMDEIALKLAA